MKVENNKDKDIENLIKEMKDLSKKIVDNPYDEGAYEEFVNILGKYNPSKDEIKDATASTDEKVDQNIEETEKKEKNDKDKKSDVDSPLFSPIANMVIDLNSLIPGLGQGQKSKKRKKLNKPPFDIKDIDPPHIIKAKLDEYVIGQEKAKKTLCVAVYNHYKRVYYDYLFHKKNNKIVEEAEEKDTDENNVSEELVTQRFVDDDINIIEKSNVLMIGPTGCGKTYMVKVLARILNVPLAIADATSLTESGYIGDDIESIISKLIKEADGDIDRAEYGIVFIDEIDKLSKKKNNHSRDVNGEGVQQELLKMLEGTTLDVPLNGGQKNPMSQMTRVKTDNILFVCGGAFPDLEDIIIKRMNKRTGIGFNSEIDKCDTSEVFDSIEDDDLRKFGMIPEFLGRLPIRVSLKALDEEALKSVLKKPKNAIIRQYKKLFELDEVDLEFDDEALDVIAKRAIEKKTGARALRSIIEDYMLDIMYEIPKDKNIGKVIITKDYLENKGAPTILMRGEDA